MTAILTRISGVLYRWRWPVWAVFVLSWTAGLIMPIPGDGPWEIETLRIDLKFLAGKSLHVLAYAVLTILTGRLAVAPRFRWLLMFFLMFHACLTEVIQLRISYRSGTLEDVLFDQLGIALGVVISWNWWTAPAAGPPPGKRSLAANEEVYMPLR